LCKGQRTFKLAVWYHTSPIGDKIAVKIIKGFGVKAKIYKVEVENHEAVVVLVDWVAADFGRLDVIIANAGTPLKAGGLEDKLKNWNRVRAVYFDGAYYCAYAAGFVFNKQGYGNYIFIASISGNAVNVPHEQSCYNACKAGVVSQDFSLPQIAPSRLICLNILLLSGLSGWEM
jgi:sorbose reductase